MALQWQLNTIHRLHSAHAIQMENTLDDLMTLNTKDKRRTTEDNIVILKPAVRGEGKLASAGKGEGTGHLDLECKTSLWKIMFNQRQRVFLPAQNTFFSDVCCTAPSGSKSTAWAVK